MSRMNTSGIGNRMRTLHPDRIRGKFFQLGWSLVRAVIILGIGYIILYPIFYMVSMSVKVRADLFDPGVVWITRQFNWNTVISNYSHVMKVIDYTRYLFSTVNYTFWTTLVQLICACLVGYGFARFQFKGRKLLFPLVILTMIIPPVTTVIPSFLHFRYFDLFGIFQAILGAPLNLNQGMLPVLLLGITGFGLKNGLYIFIFRQFFLGMPKELEEAAYIDGCSAFRTFLRIMLPLAGGPILIVSILSTVWQYTDTFYSFIFCNNIDHIISGLKRITLDMNLHGSNQVDYATSAIYQSASMVLALGPLILFYIVMQRNFAQSIEKTGIVE